MSPPSDDARSRRLALKPNTDVLDEDLPINAHREVIMDALRTHPVLVVAGETGSGKTTQLPRFALAAGFGRERLIGHTQPRRIAARSVAARIAEETDMPLGEGVGFAVRFDDRTAPQTLVRIMTDGILLNEAQRDAMLSRYEVIIIDEAHERSLNIDCLLGLLKRVLRKRSDLRVIVTSATIDVERFSQFFDNAPVIEVSGRGYPVRVEYMDAAVAIDDSRRLARQVADGVRQLLSESLPKTAQDILVFLPGEREIRDAERAIAKSGAASKGYEIVPLFGRLGDKDQQSVFRPGGNRRIVLATNVAETSITVPRIGAVLDSGLARINRYSPRARVTQLQLEAVSQASANQRSGRCGRLGPGVCLRLYSEADYASRSEFTDPEMLRTNLASVVLQISALNIGAVSEFPFPDPPDPGRLDDALRELRELKALDNRDRITQFGRNLARLPLDPRLGTMLLSAKDESVRGAVLIVVAGLSIQDPRQRPVEAAGAADLAHAEFADSESDFMTLLRLWAAGENARREGRSAWERWCGESFLSPRRMREWREVASQIGRMAQSKPHPNVSTLFADKERRRQLHQAILSGLLTRIGHLREPGVYDGVSGRAFGLHKASSLSSRAPKWLMALEVVRTHKAMARYAAGISPGSVAAAAAHLTRYEYTRPYWNARKGRVESKRSTLLGRLVLVSNRRVPYDKVDRAASRRVFIRDALVADRLGKDYPFADFNRAEREALAQLAGQLRRAVEVRAARIEQHFDDHLPPEVSSRATLERWLSERREHDLTLRIDREQLLSEAAKPDLEMTPQAAPVKGNTLPLSYAFSPDRDDDGATLTVPAGLLGALTPSDIEQSVPAFLQQRVAARLKALPKKDRKRLHPIAQTASAIVTTLSALPETALGLDDRLQGVLLREYSIQIEPGVWSSLVEPEHWLPRIQVTDEVGNPLAAGRDLEALRIECGPLLPKPQIKPKPKVNDGANLGFPTLKSPYAIRRGGAEVTVYPALSAQPDGVVVHEFLDPVSAADAHAEGVFALLLKRFRDQVKSLRKSVLQDRNVLLQWATFEDEGGAALVDDVVRAAFRGSFGANVETVRDPVAWQALCERGAAEVVPTGMRIQALLPEVLGAHAQCRQQLSKTSDAYGEAVDDVQQQIVQLVFPGFLMATPHERIDSLTRYLRAASMRLQRIASNPAKDNDSLAMIRSLQARHVALNAFTGVNQKQAAINFRWLIEEFRVSLFAQSLGTSEKVSLRRLEKRWDEILRMPD
ncbi:MAG: ATP-dependent RNA helicase HrpA [Pseudomonadota bacterium]